MTGIRKDSHLPIAAALGKTQLVAVVTALLIAGAVLVVYQLMAMRQALTTEARVQAAIVADNAAAPLMFRDPAAANEMLRSFRYAPYLQAVAIYDRHGALFAQFARASDQLPAASAAIRPDRGGSLTVVEKVSYRAAPLGQVVLRTSTAGLSGSIWRYIALLVVASIAAMVLVRLLIHKTRAKVVAAERELAYLAHTDHVTGLPNRRATYTRLEQEMARALANGTTLAFMLVDLDNFKVVNDTAGHAAGDELLRQVGLMLASSVRGSDMVGRIGGDEFAIIAAPVANRATAVEIASKVTQALRRPFMLESGETFATASVGLCLFPDDADSTSELVSRADTALYHAKNSGRNRLAEFTPSMTMLTQRRAFLERELRRAVETEALQVYYQPQFDCASGAMIGVEALLRWPQEGQGFISPAEFIPIAEETGLILPLGRWALQRACHDAAAWERENGLVLNVAVNVSARQLREPGFIDDVLRALQGSGLAPTRLELELTESLLMEDVEAAITFMQAVRAIGVRLSIDDFGTGYSSLSYLQSFPINQLKVDRSFVQLLPKRGDTIVNAVIALARGFGLTVVAEGVENQQQLEWLRQAGCDYVQGFLLALPMAAAALVEQYGGGSIPPAAAAQGSVSPGPPRSTASF